MRAVLDGFSAYEFWMSSLSGSGHYLDLPNPRLTEFDGSSSCGDLSHLIQRQDGKDGFLHLLVHNKAERRKADNIICHCWGSKPLPPRAICEIGDGLYAVSPELCLLRIAPFVTRLELLRATSNLMGDFCFSFLDRISLIQREPLITKEDMRSFLQHCKGLSGARLTAQAVEWAIERAASPREVSVGLAMNLPSRAGGQNLGPIEANVPVPLNDNSRPLTTKRYLVADVGWEQDKNLFVEYNSDKFHDTEEQKQYDFEKITALQRMGKVVVPISTRQFNDYEAFASISSGLRSRLGKRDRSANKYESVRRKTHEELLAVERRQRQDANLRETSRWQALIPRLDFDN